MGRRTIWRPTGASFAATFVSVLFPFLLHLTIVPFCISASQSNTTDPTTTPPEQLCDCNSSSFCYNKTCVPLLNLNLTVLAVTSKALTFSWSIIDVKISPNVSLHLTCIELNGCSCGANVSEEFRRTFTIDNLHSSSLLLFKAVAQLNNTDVSHLITKRVLTLPVLPDNITFSNANSTAVKVEWTPYEQCVDTRLEIQNASNTILTNASISDGYVLIGSLVPGTRRILQVRAVVTADGKVEKSNHSLHSVTTRPMPPEGLMTTKEPFRLNITFKASLIGHYDYFQVEYLASNGNWTPGGNTNNTSNFVLISGLRPFSTYKLRAQSVAFGVFSSYYEENVTTGEFEPSSPTVVEHTNSLVIWKSPDTPNGIILSYELQWTLSCGKLVQVKNQTFKISAANHTWPMPSGFGLLGYRHCVRIRAKNSFSFGNWSANSCSLKLVDSTLGPELNINASSDTASIAWSSTTCPGFVIGYFLLLQRRNPDNFRISDACLPGSRRLSCSNCNSPDVNNLFASLTSVCGGVARNETFESEITKIKITSLQPGNIYRVTLYSAGSNRSLHNISRNFSTQQVHSSQPQSLSVIPSSDKALTVTWGPPQAPGGLLLHYLAWIDAKPPQCFLCNCTGCESRADYVKLTEQGQQQLENAVRSCQTSYNCTFKPEQGPTSAKFDHLPAFTNFTVYVSAVNSLGLGSSNASAQNATQEGKPDPPTWVRITKVTDISVWVAWSKSPNPRGIPRAYFVDLNNSGGSKQMELTDTFASFTNLSACTAYEASVTVANSVQNSSRATSNQTLTHPTPPAPVSNLQLLVRKSTMLEASWNATENVGNCEVSYRVVLKSAGSEKVNKIQKGVSIVFQSLQPFTAYTVEVVAIVTSSDGSRLESLPRNISNTTKEDAPSAPRTLRCQSKNHTSILCTWKEPIPTNGRIQHYEVWAQPPALNSPYNVSGKDLSTIFTMPKSVSSGEAIHVSVKAFTSVTFGMPAIYKTQLPDGPPDIIFTQQIKNEMGKDANNVNDQQTQVRINYKTEWFVSNRGKVIHLTIIVRECCNKRPSLTMTHSGTPVDHDTSTWYASNAGRSNFYAAIRINTTERRRQKRSTSTSKSVIVGIQECPNQNMDYCNGPLNPDTKYEMYIRGYTSNAFSTLGPVTTATMPHSNNNLTIGLVVGFLLLVVLIAVGIAIHQWRKKNIDKPSTSPGNGTVNPFVPPDDIHMTLFNATNASVSELAQMVSEGREVDVPLEQFEDFVEDMNKDSRLKYTDAFNEVKKKALKNETTHGLTTEEAGQQYNRLKNRFANVLPFDHTRVCLRSDVCAEGIRRPNSSSDDDPFSGMDYINANFVAGYRRQREFIACQGPLPQTVDDFWRMVWEQNVHLIVMLTKVVEKGRSKCEPYWPNEINKTSVYGDIAVCLLSESVVASHVVRVCSLTLKGDDSRMLTHLQMITWDDFLAPSPQDLTNFMRAYRSHLPPPNGNKSESPTVVHCSAGVGRTGTFICLDTLIRRLESGHNSINVNAVIYAMRKQRRLLVQSERQYIFIHDFLVSYLQQRNAAAAANRRDAAEGDEGSTTLLDVRASHVNNAYEKEDIL